MIVLQLHLINIISFGMNQQLPQHQFKPVYYLQRPHSPKNIMNHTNSAKNISLTMSIGANQTPSNFIPSYKTKTQLPQPATSDTSLPAGTQKSDKQLEIELKKIFKQNQSLREQNQNLRRELQKMKKEPNFQNARSSQKYSAISPQSTDLRGTIKKQMGQIKQMRIKLQMLSKQCKMYEQIIDKMDERIKKLSHDNNRKNSQIDDLQSELSKLDQLKDKTNSIMRMYSDLESKFNDHQLEWMKWKQVWFAEKETYLVKIRELESRNRD